MLLRLKSTFCATFANSVLANIYETTIKDPRKCLLLINNNINNIKKLSLCNYITIFHFSL